MLGAFLAGGVLRRWAPGDTQRLDAKLDAIGYGFFIPILFVAAGMSLDLASIAKAPARVAGFLVLLLMVRGPPAFPIYRRLLDRRERFQMVFMSATSLPLLVALSQIGLANGTTLPENAAALSARGSCPCWSTRPPRLRFAALNRLAPGRQHDTPTIEE